jgi:hypothetical protein
MITEDLDRAIRRASSLVSSLAAERRPAYLAAIASWAALVVTTRRRLGKSSVRFQNLNQ